MNPIKIETTVSIRNLTKRFGSFTAVDNVSFDVLKGEIFGFLGPNGAGKTTTINMICGLLPPTTGSVNFHYSGSMKSIKSHIGYCPQDNIFFPKLTCLEQLVFLGEMYGIQHSEAITASKRLLELIGLKDKKNVLAGKLSGGMKRRLSIYLAMVHNPEILILDEPEAGLDPQSRILVREFIKSFGRERTIILTTHNMDEADRLANRIAIIDNGKLLLLDTPQNLKRTIGEGDLLEIFCNTNELEKAVTALNSLSDLSQHTITHGNSLMIKSQHLIDRIPAIVELLRVEHIDITEIKLRENTLEDVFIHLTGRNLRQ
jgi:ABC-2 type transport system ATP-binding protein